MSNINCTQRGALRRRGNFFRRRIGDKIYPGNYKGDFKGMPVFIGTSNPDFQVPVEHNRCSSKHFKGYGCGHCRKNVRHTIIKDEIDWANKIIFK